VAGRGVFYLIVQYKICQSVEHYDDNDYNGDDDHDDNYDVSNDDDNDSENDNNDDHNDNDHVD